MSGSQSRLRDQTSLAASSRRVWAMVLRYWYVIRSSWPRTAELVYWPLVQMLMWGFLQSYLAQTANFAAKAAGLFIGAVLLWDILVRSQLGFAVAFLEEIWSRNLGHLFVSPLRPYEMVLSLGTMSLIRTVIGVVPASIMAVLFFGFSLASLGLSLVGFFFLLLIMGWALGLLICGIVMRYGQGAESLAWAAIFAVAPVSGVYYPIAVLPVWLQWVAHGLPSSYVFEGMRGILVEGDHRPAMQALRALLD